MKSEFEIIIHSLDFRPVEVSFRVETDATFDSRCGVCLASFNHVVKTIRSLRGKQLMILGSKKTPGNFIWIKESQNSIHSMLSLIRDTCKHQIEFGHIKLLRAASVNEIAEFTF